MIIRGGSIVTPEATFTADIAVEDSRIAAIARGLQSACTIAVAKSHDRLAELAARHRTVTSAPPPARHPPIAAPNPYPRSPR